MTIKEFFDWAIEHEVMNAEIHVLHRNDDGCYCGYDILDESDIGICARENYVAID